MQIFLVRTASPQLPQLNHRRPALLWPRALTTTKPYTLNPRAQTTTKTKNSNPGLQLERLRSACFMCDNITKQIATAAEVQLRRCLVAISTGQGQLQSGSTVACWQVGSCEVVFTCQEAWGGGVQGEHQKYEEEMDWDKTKKLVRIRTNIFMIMQVRAPGPG